MDCFVCSRLPFPANYEYVCYNNFVMDAIVLINKPKGITSFDAVSKVKRICHEKKVGHTGTLDPEASGLLIILLGRYTKYIPYCVCDHKRYHATFRLGLMTETQDIWGATVREKKPERVYSEEELEKTCTQFRGAIRQIPPMYSALKKDGVRLYELARKGIEVEREPRDAFISHLEVHHLHDDEYEMDAEVSSGTYIRTLIQDFGESLGELATMTSLVRYGIESIDLSEAVSFEELEQGKGMVSPLRVLNPEWKLMETDKEEDVRNGKRIHLDCKEDQVILTSNGNILAAYKREQGNQFKCVRGLF